MMLLHYNGAAVNRSAPMHRWLAMVVRSTSAHGRTIVDRTTCMVHGLAFMHAGTLMVRSASAHGRTVVAGVAFMYGRPLLPGRVLVHGGTLMAWAVPVHSRALLSGCILVHNRALVTGCIFMDALALVAGVSLHRPTLLPGRALLHRRSGLLTGAASLLRADLLCLCWSLAAGLAGRRRFRNTHYKRGAEKTGHQFFP